MHESDSPPAPPRFRRRARCQLVMAHNNGVGDVSTIQTTPPFDIYLAAHVQKVHKMIADHTALTTFASHRLFLLILYPLFLASQVLSVFSSNHVLHWGSRHCFPEDAPFILDDLQHGHRRISTMLYRFLLCIMNRKCPPPARPHRLLLSVEQSYVAISRLLTPRNSCPARSPCRSMSWRRPASD